MFEWKGPPLSANWVLLGGRTRKPVSGQGSFRQCQEGFGDKESWSVMGCALEGSPASPSPGWGEGAVLSLLPMRALGTA